MCVCVYITTLFDLINTYFTLDKNIFKYFICFSIEHTHTHIYNALIKTFILIES